MIVLMSVAKFELISLTPTFPKSAVSAAKKAEPKAKRSQLFVALKRAPNAGSIRLSNHHQCCKQSR